MTELSRRSFFRGVAATLFAAPAIVRAASLMPVKALEWDIFRQVRSDGMLYSDLVDVNRQAFVPRLFVQLYQKSPLFSAIESGHFNA